MPANQVYISFILTDPLRFLSTAQDSLSEACCVKRMTLVQSILFLFMVALCNRADHNIFVLFLLSSIFSSPNLSGRRLDVYHTLAHAAALVRI